MSNSIDERIVAMHFNNAEFEKNAHQSIKTLQELREGLNLEGAAEGFAQISKATSESLGLKETTHQASLFTRSLSTMGKMAKGVFSAATFPLKAIGNSLSTLGKYTGTVFGFDLANQLVNTGKNLVRAFTIDPIKSGWSEYNLLIDSTKTILTGTMKSYTDAQKKLNPNYVYDEAEHLAYVNSELDRLNKYADDTVYSFQDMTSNIGKFTNVGVALEDATNAMMGIANMTAYAGQGTQQAASAMYNLSQAMGMGYLGGQDWRSLENANITTVAFRDTLMQAAVAYGTLEKKGDKYYTKAAKGSKAIEVTAENIRNTLHTGWANDDVMMATFKIFSGEMSAEEIAALGFEYDISNPESAAFRLERLGQEAKKSATEVRTLGKMMDALKEASQSGWANSMKIIFGDLQESTDLWTGLNDFFSKAIDRSADARNAILQGWRGRAFDEASGEWVQIEGAIDGRQIMIDALYDILDVGQSISNIFHSAFEAVFGKITAQTLLNLTMRIKSFTGHLKDVFNVLDGGGSVGDKLKTIFSGVLSVGKMFLNTFKKIGSFVGTVFAPIGDFFLNTFAKIGEWAQSFANGDLIDFLRKLKSGFQSLTREKVSNWFIKVGDSAKNLWKSITTAAGNWLQSNNFGGVAKWITGAGDWIKNAWESVTSTLSQVWLGFTGSDFFKGVSNAATNIWDAVYGFFTKRDESDSTGFDNFVSSITSFFASIKKDIGDAWTEFTSSPFYTGVTSTVTNIWDAIYGFFTQKDESDSTGFQSFISDVTSFFERIGTEIGAKWTEFTDSGFYKAVSNTATNIWDAIYGFFTQKDESDSTGFQNFIQTVVDFFTDIGEKVGTAWNGFIDSGFYKAVSNTATNIWDAIYGFFTQKDESDSTGFQNFISNVTSFFSDIATEIGDKWTEFTNSGFYKAVSNTATNIWDAIYGFFTKKDESDSTGFQSFISDVTTFFSNIATEIGAKWTEFTNSGFYKAVSNTATNIWDAIYGFFTKRDEGGKTGFDTFVSDIVTFFTDVKEQVQRAWTEFTDSSFFKGVSEAVTNIWDSILDFFTIKDETKKTGFDNFVGDITAFLNDLSGKVTEAWNGFVNSDFYIGLSDFVSSIFDKIVGFFTDEQEGGKTGFDNFIEGMSSWFTQLGDSLSQAWTSMTGTELNFDGVITTVGGWLETIKTTVLDIWDQIYNWDGWATLGQFFSDAWGWISDKLGLNGGSSSGKLGANIPGSIGLLAAGSVSDVSSMTATAKKTADQVTETADIFSSIFNPLTNLINAAASWPGWDTFGSVIGQIFSGIQNLFTSIVDNSTIIAAFDALKGVVELILRIVNEITAFGNRLLDGDAGAIAIAAILSIVKMISQFVQIKKYSSMVAKAGTGLSDFGGQVLKFAGGLWLISLAISTLGGLDPAIFENGAVRLGGIAVAILGFYSAFNGIKKLFDSTSGINDKPVTGWERVGTYFIKWVGIAGTISAAMALLPGVISSFKDIDYTPGQFIDLFGGIAAMVVGMSAGMSIMSHVDLKGAAMSIVSLNLGIVAITSALTLLSGIMDSSKSILKVDFHHIMTNAKTFFSDLASIFGAVAGAFSGAKDAAYMTEAAQGVADASFIGATINSEGFKSFQRSMEALTELTKSLPKNPDRLAGIAKFFTGEMNLRDFTAQLPDVAANLSLFSMALDDRELFGENAVSNINSMLGFLNSMVESSKTLAVISEMTNGDSPGAVLGSFLDQFLDASGTFAEIRKQEDRVTNIPGEPLSENVKGLIEMASTFAETFNSGIELAADTITAEPLIQAIYDSLTSPDAKKTISDGFRVMSTYLQESGLVTADENGGLDMLSMFTGLLEGFELPEGGLFNVPKDANGQPNIASILGFDPATIFNQFKDESGNITFGGDMTSYFTSGQEAMKKYIEGLESEVGADGTHEVEITPVWTDTDMLSLFGTNGALEVTGSVSLDGDSISVIANGAAKVVSAVNRTTDAVNTLRNAVYAIGGKVDSVNGSVNGLGGKMDGVADAIRGISITMNVKQVAGAVDGALGAVAALKQRTGPDISSNYTPVSFGE